MIGRSEEIDEAAPGGHPDQGLIRQHPHQGADRHLTAVRPHARIAHPQRRCRPGNRDPRPEGCHGEIERRAAIGQAKHHQPGEHCHGQRHRCERAGDEAREHEQGGQRLGAAEFGMKAPRRAAEDDRRLHPTLDLLYADVRQRSFLQRLLCTINDLSCACVHDGSSRAARFVAMVLRWRRWSPELEGPVCPSRRAR